MKWYVYTLDTDRFLGMVIANDYETAENLAYEQYGMLALNGLTVFDEELSEGLARQINNG